MQGGLFVVSNHKAVKSKDYEYSLTLVRCPNCFLQPSTIHKYTANQHQEIHEDIRNKVNWLIDWLYSYLETLRV